MQLPSSVTSLDLHRDNGLLAVICDDLAIRLVDVETQRIVRELRGFKGRILDSASVIDLDLQFHHANVLPHRPSLLIRDG